MSKTNNTGDTFQLILKIIIAVASAVLGAFGASAMA